MSNSTNTKPRAQRIDSQAEAVAAQMVPGDREERVLEVPLFGKEETRGE